MQKNLIEASVWIDVRNVTALKVETLQITTKGPFWSLDTHNETT